MRATCVDCGRPCPGKRARGMCSTCYSRHLLADTLTDYPRITWPADELLDEWVLLRDDGSSVADAAVRLGVSYAALRRAMHRADARGDDRGRRAPFGRATDHTDRRQQV